jgi:hypothetical protein
MSTPSRRSPSGHRRDRSDSSLASMQAEVNKNVNWFNSAWSHLAYLVGILLFRAACFAVVPKSLGTSSNALEWTITNIAHGVVRTHGMPFAMERRGELQRARATRHCRFDRSAPPSRPLASCARRWHLSRSTGCEAPPSGRTRASSSGRRRGNKSTTACHGPQPASSSSSSPSRCESAPCARECTQRLALMHLFPSSVQLRPIVGAVDVRLHVPHN